MLFQLVVTSGEEKGRVFSFKDGTAVVGRDQAADVRLSDPRVSRRQCKIEFAGDTVQLTDLDSTSGTFVNSDRVTVSSLAANDEIRVGKTSLRFCITDRSAESTQLLDQAETRVCTIIRPAEELSSEEFDLSSEE